MPEGRRMGLEPAWARAAVTLGSATVLALLMARLVRRMRHKGAGREADAAARGVVTALHRFAVKGLGADPLTQCRLEVGGCFPSDRKWALMREDRLHEFDAMEPKWVHKMSFFAACSAGQPLALLETAFDDASCTLLVRSKSTGSELLSARLDDSEGRASVESFFSEHLCKDGSRADVRVVSAAGATPHQFGNTSGGVEASGDVRTVHLVNLNTVRALSEAAGKDLDPSIFRANLLFDGPPPFEEFRWVGRAISVGAEVRMRVIKRTVRCAATCVDLKTAAQGPDVPGLLQQHFPEHGPYLGVYAQVVRAGTVRLGDEVELLDGAWWLPWRGWSRR